jgi:nucleotide-binding universal stress UspA family protein
MNTVSLNARRGEARNVLLVVRRDRDMEWAVNFVTQLHRREPVRIHLLSVQTPFTGHVRMFFDDAAIRAFHLEDGEVEVAPVKQALDRAGVPCETHIQVGFSAATIADFAREHRCRQIVMGPPRKGLVSQLLLGSLTEQVAHLMQSNGQACEVV